MTKNFVNLSCSVGGIYPVPDVRLQLEDIPIRQDGREVSRERSYSEPYYDVTVWKIFPRNLTNKETTLGCQIQIIGTQYSLVLQAFIGKRDKSVLQAREESQLGDLLFGGCGGLLAFVVTFLITLKLCNSCKIFQDIWKGRH